MESPQLQESPMNANRRNRILSAALVAIAAAVSSCASDAPPENRRTTGEFTSDAALTAKVKSAIATDIGARTAAAINIETYRGVVQLTGFVDSREQAAKAEESAKKVEGVRSVKNDVRIKSTS
jgi:hyperosmotically inducible periplasmic protein